jgi:DMSO/TMAO reductase YedYZ molybdopterin-dependent catalytic subunit
MIVVSVLLALATVIILAFGLIWKWNLSDYYIWIAGFGYTAIGWHWGIAIYLLIPLFIIHAWRRWPHPKKTDFAGRRQTLKLMGVGLAAIAGWRISEALAATLQEDITSRRFTGSREEGSFAGNAHPITSGPGQGRLRLDPAAWKLSLTGAVTNILRMTYADALNLSTSEITATLDCTGGWYTIQTWRGIFLRDLLSQAQIRQGASGIVLKGVTEYRAYFTFAQADEILLATFVGSEVLNHNHGFPLRAVVPSRRGWHWVKWLTEIEVLAIS